MKRDNSETLLAQWQPPTVSGEPLGCLATTFTFDPSFFEEECLARFLEIDSLADREGLAYILERENRLGSIYAGVLVDQHQASVDHSLRWDVLPVRIHRGVQHAKLTLLLWSNYMRIIVASSNITTSGYRSNQEVAGILDFNKDKANKEECDRFCLFLESLLEFVPGIEVDDPAVHRAINFLAHVKKITKVWGTTNNHRDQIKTHFIFTIPQSQRNKNNGGKKPVFESALQSCIEKCMKYGNAPSSVWVTSPFFDTAESNNYNAVTDQLCKSMARGRKREVAFCVPLLSDEEEQLVRLAAPESLYATAKKRVNKVLIRTLPVKDKDNNIRLWHAKMLWLENEYYYALMIGSSNFTSSGMGISSFCNAEANILYVGKQKAYSKNYSSLNRCFPETKLIKDFDNIEWTDEQIELEEDKKAYDEPVVPKAFLSAIYNAGENPSLVFRFITDELPDRWEVFGGRKFDDLLLDYSTYKESAKKSILSIKWKHEYAPGKLLVKWQDKNAFWTVNVEDEEQLQLPKEIEEISADDLLKILGSADTSSAFRAWARSYYVPSIDDALDSSLPAELDPLRRYNLEDTFLHKIRRRAYVLERIRSNLERPVWSKKALEWRLRGILGIENLAERLSRGLDDDMGEKVSESVLGLADFLLMLNETDYSPVQGALSRGHFYKRFNPFVNNMCVDLAEKVKKARRYIPRDIYKFWKGVLKECQK